MWVYSFPHSFISQLVSPTSTWQWNLRQIIILIILIINNKYYNVSRNQKITTLQTLCINKIVLLTFIFKLKFIIFDFTTFLLYNKLFVISGKY